MNRRQMLIRKVLPDLLWHGQPVYEELDSDAQTVTWLSRKVSGDYPKNWKFEGDAKLLCRRVNSQAGIVRGQVALLRVKGIRRLKGKA
jgi:hypothetical protein